MTPTVLRWIYAICLVAGASTHVWAIAAHGLAWDYNGAPVFSRIYWTSLVPAMGICTAGSSRLRYMVAELCVGTYGCVETSSVS